MKKPFSLIFILLVISLFMSEGVWANCTIEKGPPPELVKYLNDTRAELSKIRSEAGALNQCKGKEGSFSAERKFFSLLDRIDLEGSITDTAVNLPQDIVMDFLYNVTFAAEGQSRGPVTAHGKLFKDLENSSIVRTLENVAALCALDVTIPSGGTPEIRIAKILRDHRKIERFFWKASTGDPTKPDGLEKYKLLLDSIQSNYSTETTSSCKSPYNIEDAASSIMTKLGNLTKGTKDGNKAWEEAIELFQGKNKGTAAYVKLQSRLLQTEMARQGLSQNAKKAMLKNLTCPEQKTDPNSSPEDRAKAEYECHRDYVIGFDTVTNPLVALISTAKTTDEYIARQVTYAREKTRVSEDMGKYWSNLVKLKSADEPLNEKLLNDLVNIHTELIVTSEALTKATQNMIKNCNKGFNKLKCNQNGSN